VLGAPGADRIPLLRKARSYIEQARMPMPARYESYNLLERLGPETVFSQAFLRGVDRTQPLRIMKSVYDGAHARTLINRMLALDLKYTLADNDLPKVTLMCDAAGIDVAFPLLDDAVVDFSAKLPPGLKLKGTQLRYFFKAALRDYLPPEILAKEKHGFGLPVGAWLRSHAPLRSLAESALERLGERGILDEAFLRNLVQTRLNEHPGYYGAMIWVLMMLELWFQHHLDRRSPVSRLAR
jgi:asparagine synthase (glutamine-hydrolysing)